MYSNYIYATDLYIYVYIYIYAGDVKDSNARLVNENIFISFLFVNEDVFNSNLGWAGATTTTTRVYIYIII